MGIIQSICRRHTSIKQQQQQQQHPKYNNNNNNNNNNNINDKHATMNGSIKLDNSDGSEGANKGFDKSDDEDNDEDKSDGETDRIVVRGLFDYQAIHDDDLSFRKGEKMEVIENRNSDWWYAKKSDGQRGYIPSNYVVVDDKRAETQDWWFDVDRREAARQLLLPCNTIGTFLVRKAADNRSFALSILVEHPPPTAVTSTLPSSSLEKCIKHYRIKKNDKDHVYISKHLTFTNLLDLINHYKTNLSGLVCLLTNPCPRELVNVPFKALEVDRNQVALKECLGAGQFGEVFRALINDKQQVAVKTLKKGSSMKVEEFKKEAMIMHQLRHRRLVQLLGVCMQSQPCYIITEYMSEGCLSTYLHKNKDQLDFSHLVDIAAQVADGMSYLECQDPPFIHRDLRAANVLVAENNVVKVADFGLAKIVSDGIYEGNEGCKFPVKWTAPEGLKYKIFTVKSDVWSYGVLLFEIFTYGKAPYVGWTPQEIKEKVVQGYQLQFPGAFDDKVYQTMRSCWAMEASARPSFAQLLDFFDNVVVQSNYFVADAEKESDCTE